MNWQQIEGKWQDYKGQIQQRWGKLTDNDLTVIRGRREELAGKLRATYGKTREQVEKEIAEFEASCKDCGTGKPKTEDAKASGSGSD